MARKLPLPRGWKRRVESSIVHVVRPSATADLADSTIKDDTFQALVGRQTSVAYRGSRILGLVAKLLRTILAGFAEYERQFTVRTAVCSLFSRGCPAWRMRPSRVR